MRELFIAVFLTFSVVSAQANDSAVETSAGGLKLRKEHSVLMEKERLFISRSLVRVEYEFRNTTNEPVVSEVAFPIPAFKYVFDDSPRDFADFKAWIDDKQVKVKREVRAFVKNRDVTEDLRRAGITIETFGGYDPSAYKDELMALKPDVRNRLVKVGALKAPKNKEAIQDYSPVWEVSIKYHWQQEFPPGTVVRIKHEYHPVAGYSQVQLQDFQKEYRDSCANKDVFSEAKKRVAKAMKKNKLINNFFGISWVTYILTTANTWQTPIKDFELIVAGEKGDLVTFCWDGPVEKTSDVRYRATKADFVPDKDLKIYFLRNF